MPREGTPGPRGTRLPRRPLAVRRGGKERPEEGVRRLPPRTHRGFPVPSSPSSSLTPVPRPSRRSRMWPSPLRPGAGRPLSLLAVLRPGRWLRGN